MKKTKKILLGLAIFGVISSPMLASARSIGYLNNFKLPAWKGVTSTGYVTKAATGGATIVNLGTIDGQGTGSYAIDGCLTNSGDSQRSDYVYGIMENTRTAISNWSSAKAGYNYKFKCCNHNSVNLNAYVSGSWSPDAN